MSDLEEIKNKLREDRKRIITLEGDVNTLKVDVGKISVSLEHNEKLAKDRYDNLSTQQMRLINLFEERERDAREYRQSRETQEREALIERSKLIRNFVNPQTIAMVIAAALSMIGIRAGEFLMLAEEAQVETAIEEVQED